MRADVDNNKKKSFLYIQCEIYPFHQPAAPGRTVISTLAGCSEGSVHHPADSQKVPKLRQTHPEQVSMLETRANCPHPRLVRSREVQGGYRQLVSPPLPPECSLALRHAGRFPMYTHSRGQKGQCGLDTGASSLTSESFSKCHLAPERQHQQWLPSSKEHLRPGAPVKPTSAGMITFYCTASLSLE